MTLSIAPLTPAVGAEVSGVDLARLTDAEFASIEDAWHRHSALLFRGQRLTDDDLLSFSRRLGELDPPPNQEQGRISPPGYPDIYVVSNVLDDKGRPIGALGAGEAVWHTDMSYLDLPPDASMLYALEIPPEGGDTWICGMEAAWASLPEALKARLHGRRIKHDGTYNSGGYLRQGRRADRRPAQGARSLASRRVPASGNRRAGALSRTPAQFLRRGPLARRVGGVARRPVGAHRAAAACLRPQMAGGRSPVVGQPLDHAPARSVRRQVAPHHASHADQGPASPAGVLCLVFPAHVPATRPGRTPPARALISAVDKAARDCRLVPLHAGAG